MRGELDGGNHIRINVAAKPSMRVLWGGQARNHVEADRHDSSDR